MNRANFALFLLLIASFILIFNFAGNTNSITGYTIVANGDGTSTVTSRVIPAVRDGQIEINSFTRVLGGNMYRGTCAVAYQQLYSVDEHLTDLQIPYDFATYDAATRSYSSGTSRYICVNGDYYREDQGVIITSQINQLRYSAFCPDSNYCVDSTSQCIAVSGQTIVDANTFTCTNDAQWRQNQIEQPPVPENELTPGVLTQSYVPGEVRARPPARQGECPQEGMCVALDGSCHFPGELRGQLMCAEYSTWKGCRGNRHSVNVNHPSAIEEEYYSNLDVAPGMNYICKNNQWTRLSCTPTRSIVTDVILDTAYPSNNDFTDEAIRNTIARMTKYLCSQTDPNGVGFTLRRIIRNNYNGVPGPRTAAFDAALTSTYPQGDYPQYAIFIGNLTYNAGAAYGVMVANQNYCNSIPPTHGEGNAVVGTNSFVTTVARQDQDIFGDELRNGRTNYGGYYGAALFVHEFLHAYTFNSHYESAECLNYISNLGVQDRKNTVLGICPDALINLVNARAQCAVLNTNISPRVRSATQSITETRVDVGYVIGDAPTLKKTNTVQNKITSRTKPTSTGQFRVVRKPNDFIVKSSESPANPVDDFVIWVKNLFGAK